LPAAAQLHFLTIPTSTPNVQSLDECPTFHIIEPQYLVFALAEAPAQHLVQHSTGLARARRKLLARKVVDGDLRDVQKDSLEMSELIPAISI
jgi:hypothetical protein